MIFERTIIIVDNEKIIYSTKELINNTISKKDLLLTFEIKKDKNIYYPLIPIWKIEDIEDEFYQFFEKINDDLPLEINENEIEIQEKNTRKTKRNKNSQTPNKKARTSVNCTMSKDCKEILKDLNNLDNFLKHFSNHGIPKNQRRLLFVAILTQQKEYPNTIFDPIQFLKEREIKIIENKDNCDVIENHPDFENMKLLFEKPLSHNNIHYLIFSVDFETAKITREARYISQIASFAHLKEFLGKGFCCFVKPREAYPEFYINSLQDFYFHQVIYEMVEKCMNIEESFSKYIEWIRKIVKEVMIKYQIDNLQIIFVAHNSGYDKDLFESALKLCKIDLNDLKYTFVDSMSLIRKVLGYKDCSLSSILDNLGIKKDGHHFATSDIRLTSTFSEEILSFDSKTDKNFLDFFVLNKDLNHPNLCKRIVDSKKIDLLNKETLKKQLNLFGINQNCKIDNPKLEYWDKKLNNDLWKEKFLKGYTLEETRPFLKIVIEKQNELANQEIIKCCVCYQDLNKNERIASNEKLIFFRCRSCHKNNKKITLSRKKNEKKRKGNESTQNQTKKIKSTISTPIQTQSNNVIPTFLQTKRMTYKEIITLPKLDKDKDLKEILKKIDQNETQILDTIPNIDENYTIRDICGNLINASVLNTLNDYELIKNYIIDSYYILLLKRNLQSKTQKKILFFWYRFW